MFVLYESTPYEPSIIAVNAEMRDAKLEIDKMENIKNNLTKVANIVLEKITDL